jgi:hypothetical protein
MSAVPNDTEFTISGASVNRLLDLLRKNIDKPDSATSSEAVELLETVTGTKTTAAHTAANATASNATATEPHGFSAEASAIRAQASQSQVNTAVTRCKEAFKAKSIEADMLGGISDVGPFCEAVNAIAQVAIELNLSSAQTKDLFTRLFPSSADTLRALPVDHFSVSKAAPFLPPAACTLAARVNCKPVALSQPTSGMKLLSFVSKVKSDMQLIYGPSWASSLDTVRTFNLHILPHIGLTTDVPRYRRIISECKSPAELDALIRENEWKLSTQSTNAHTRNSGGRKNGSKNQKADATPVASATAKSSEQTKSPYVATISFVSTKTPRAVVPAFAIDKFGAHIPVRAGVDTMATDNAISATIAHRLRLPVRPTRTTVKGATSSMSSQSSGVTDVSVVVGAHAIALKDALVIADLCVDVLIGEPAQIAHGIATRYDEHGRFNLEVHAPTHAQPLSSATSISPAVIAATATSGKSFQFDSATDEMMSHTDWSQFSPWLRDSVRRDLKRLEAAELLIGTNSPSKRDFPLPIKGFEHTIKLRPGAKISDVYAPWRPRSAEQQQALDERVATLVRDGIVRYTTDTGYSQLVPFMVPKHDADGNIVGWRMVLDGRPLCDLIEYTRHDSPSVTQMTQFASLADRVSIWDCKDWYLQMRVDESSRKLLRTRVGPNTFIEFNRIPFGVSDASAVAQSVADRLLRRVGANLPYQVQYYQDDGVMVHHDKSERALAAAVTAHVDAHIKHNVTVNATKSSLFNEEVTVLGHRVSRNSIAPIRERVLELQNIAAPTTRSDLGSLLAVFRWYAKCIPNLSELTAPLSDLMSTKVAFKWLQQHDAALERLKKALLHYVVRAAPVDGVPFIVSTDASAHAVSYVIEQIIDGQHRIIACGSRKLTSAEANYTVPGREMLALSFAIKANEWVLPPPGSDMRVIVRTDSQTVARLRTLPLSAHTSIAVQHRAIELAALPLDIELVKGSDNVVADALSRNLAAHRQRRIVPLIAMLLGTHNDSDDEDDSSTDVSDNAVSAHSADADDDSTPTRAAPSPRTADSARSSDSTIASSAHSARPPATPAHVAPTSGTATPAPMSPARAIPPTPPSEVPSGESHVRNATPTTSSSPATPPPSASSPLSATPSASPTAPTPAETTSDKATPIAPSAIATSPFFIDQYIDAASHTASSAMARLIAAQRADPDLRLYYAAANGSVVPPEVARLRVCIGKHGELLKRLDHDTSQTVPVVPKKLIPEYCRAAHGGAFGHVGARASLTASRSMAWWPTQARDVQECAQQCPTCQSGRRVPVNASLGELEAHARLDLCVMDLVPMPEVDNCIGFHVIVDAATGFVFAHATRDKTAASAVAAVRAFISVFDAPRVLRVDNAQELMGTEMQALAASEGFVLQPNSPHNHQSLGMAEAHQAYVKRELLHACQSQGNVSAWLTALPLAVRAVNSRVSSVRRASAKQMMFGIAPHVSAPVNRRYGIESNETPIAVDGTKHAHELGQRIAALESQADAQRQHRHEINARYQKSKGTDRDINVGDYVFVDNNDETENTAFQNKLRQSGPYQVTAIDVVQRRATLTRPADGVTLKTPVSMNRLQCVDKESVTTVRAPVGEPFESTWSGITDTQLLLESERRAVEKTKEKEANTAELAAQRQRELDAEAARRDARRRAAEQVRREEEQRDRSARIAARQSQQQLADRLATAAIPAGATPISVGYLAGGGLMTLASGATRVQISSKHAQYAHYFELFKASRRPVVQRAMRRRQ